MRDLARIILVPAIAILGIAAMVWAVQLVIASNQVP